MSDEPVKYFGVYLSHDTREIRLVKDYHKAPIVALIRYIPADTPAVFLPEGHPIPTAVEEVELLRAIHPTYSRYSDIPLDDPFTGFRGRVDGN
jgi:hypothetical protein